jgi:hypothetical protein
MLRILNEDGFDIKERELMRVRAKNRWLLRVPNGGKGYAEKKPKPKSAQRKAQAGGKASRQLEPVLFPTEKLPDLLADRPPQLPEPPVTRTEPSPLSEPAPPSPPSPPAAQLPPEEIARRRERIERLQAESAERWATRKRRRRTRGWAGLPADPPGPPRFPSETTLDESKVLLSLSAEMYRQTRDRFQTICEESGIIKKTISGPEKWQQAKDRLIQESPHLQSVFWGDQTQLDSKALALDVVCTDVTKRMRTLERRMTIAEAKNTLGINPEQSRQIRDAFYQTLKADHFTSKLEAGDAHWNELKEQWIQGSELLKQIVAPGDVDPEHQKKLRALEVLCRDVMKRLGDDQRKLDPNRKKQKLTQSADMAIAAMNAHQQQRQQQQQQQELLNPPHHHPDHDNLQIDPSLLLAANDPSLALDQQLHHHLHHHAAQSVPTFSIPVYFRLSPLSHLPDLSVSQPKLWLATLTSVSVAELRDLATSRHQGTTVTRIEGTIKDQATGGEVRFEIDEQDELEAYLAHVNGGKATFVVQLVGDYV